MDDLKLFNRDKTKLQQKMNNVKTFIDDIQMEFGLDKCATAVFKHGKLTKSQNLSLNNLTAIMNKGLDEYLGTEEADGIDSRHMKDKLVKEYDRWVRQILKTELNMEHKITAINTLDVPVPVYRFGIINWLRKEIEKINQNLRKQLSTENLLSDNRQL